MNMIDTNRSIREFILRIGGPQAVADRLSQWRPDDKPLTRQRVGNWSRVGVPHEYRGGLAMMALDAGLTTNEIPEDILPFVQIVRG